MEVYAFFALQIHSAFAGHYWRLFVYILIWLLIYLLICLVAYLKTKYLIRQGASPGRRSQMSKIARCCEVGNDRGSGSLISKITLINSVPLSATWFGSGACINGLTRGQHVTGTKSDVYDCCETGWRR